MKPSVKSGFPPLQLEEFDARLDAEAARRGIPTLTTPTRPAVPPKTAAQTPQARDEPTPASTGAAAPNSETATPKSARPAKRRTPSSNAAPQAPQDNQATPRSRMKSLNVELPDYVWVELKSRAAREMVSVRHVIMRLLTEAGIDIAAADLIEDGRRLR